MATEIRIQAVLQKVLSTEGGVGGGYSVVRMRTTEGVEFRLGTREFPMLSTLVVYTLTGEWSGEADKPRQFVLSKEGGPIQFKALPLCAATIRTLLMESSLKKQVRCDTMGTVPPDTEDVAAWFANLSEQVWFDTCVRTAQRTRWWFRAAEYNLWWCLYNDHRVFEFDDERLDGLRTTFNEDPIALCCTKMPLSVQRLMDCLDSEMAPSDFESRPLCSAEDATAAELYQTFLEDCQQSTYYKEMETINEVEALNRLIKRESVVVVGNRIYLRFLNDQIEELKDALSAISNRAFTAMQIVMSETLDEDQQRAVTLASSESISIITGIPGSGKSHVIRNLVAMFLGNDTKPLVCALTGKACANLVARQVQAQTIHSILHRAALTSGQYDDVTTLIVEEVSMVDIELMLRLLDVLPSLTRLVMVGDPDQLPPMSRGPVLQMLLGQVPTASLTIDHRVATASKSLAVAAARIRQQQPLVMPDFPSGLTKKNMIAAIPRPETESALQLTILSVLEGLNQRFPRDTKHVQFIAFTNRDCELVNRVASKFFFPKRPERGYVVGDRLCFRTNRRHQDVVVANGQIASVVKITDAQPGSNKRGRGRTTTCEELASCKHRRSVHLDTGEILPWSVFRPVAALGYSITVHRAQGAEAPFIVFVMPLSADRVTRRLLYTAFTRASKRFVLVGDQELFNRVVQQRVRRCQGDERLACVTSI